MITKKFVEKLGLDIASQFGKNSDIEESMWFSRRGVRVLACNVVEGNTLVIPLDLPDEGEATDDMWATTSNWYCCSIKDAKSENVIQIKILGAMLPVEDQLLPTGMIASVTTPEYFLTTEGRMKNMERDLVGLLQYSLLLHCRLALLHLFLKTILIPQYLNTFRTVTRCPIFLLAELLDEFLRYHPSGNVFFIIIVDLHYGFVHDE
jgi:hypothetical protein